MFETRWAVKRFRVFLAAALLPVWAGCRPGRAAASADEFLARETRFLMGTDVTVSVVVPAEGEAQAAVAAAFEPMEMVDRRMSEYKPESELMQMNRTAHQAPVRLSADLKRVLEVSQTVAAETDGAFDVTCGPIVDLWKEAGRRGAVPTEAERAAAVARTGYSKLHLDTAAGTARFEVEGMKVVLGAVAKGYAVDLAIKAVRARGYPNALVEAGGDLMAAGLAPGGRPWRVGVQDPRDTGATGFLATLEVRDRAVVTSGNYRRFTEIAARRYSHIVDPRTGLPVDALPSVTVVAADATHADALATAVSVLGLERGMALVEARLGTECLLVTMAGGRATLHRSIGFARYEQPGERSTTKATRNTNGGRG